MKVLLLFLLFSVSVLGQTTLSVTNGSESGRVRGNAVVDVFADENPPGMIFDRWDGDTYLLSSTDNWRTRVKTGRKQINLTAVYKPVSAWSPSVSEEIGTSSMRYHFPANPVGVVFHFHGTGGSENGLFNNIEQLTYARELVDAGFAVVSLSSTNRKTAQWSTGFPPNNPDIDNVELAIQEFIGRGLITSETPVFASGISNGGAFVPRVSISLGFEGAVIFIATSNTILSNATNTPTMWNLMLNDTVLTAGSVERARTNYSILKTRGIDTEFNVLRPTPVYARRFARIPGVSSQESIEIRNALRDAGFLDGRGYLLENPISLSWLSAIPPKYTPFLSAIRDQLFISFAEHKYFSDYNRRVIRFFERQIN